MQLSLKSTLSLRGSYWQTAQKWLKSMSWSSFPELGVSLACQTQEHSFFLLLNLTHTHLLIASRAGRVSSWSLYIRCCLTEQGETHMAASLFSIHFSVSLGAKAFHIHIVWLLFESLWLYALQNNSFFLLGILITHSISTLKQMY